MEGRLSGDPSVQEEQTIVLKHFHSSWFLANTFSNYDGHTVGAQFSADAVYWRRS